MLCLTMELFNNPQEGFVSYCNSVYIDSRCHRVQCGELGPSSYVNITKKSESEVDAAIRRLKNKVTAAPDGIPSFLIRDGRILLVASLTLIFNLEVTTASFPNIWKCFKVCPVFKSGGAADVKNCRPISVLNNFANIFETVIYSRVFPLVKNYIAIDQHGL